MDISKQEIKFLITAGIEAFCPLTVKCFSPSQWTPAMGRRYNPEKRSHPSKKACSMKQFRKFSILAAVGTSTGALLGYLGQCVGNS
jgi:hypothetical protein